MKNHSDPSEDSPKREKYTAEVLIIFFIHLYLVAIYSIFGQAIMVAFFHKG